MFRAPQLKKRICYMEFRHYFVQPYPFHSWEWWSGEGLRLRGVAASLKKTQVQGQSSPERRLSEDQKQRLKKQVSIWAERTHKDVTDEGWCPNCLKTFPRFKMVRWTQDLANQGQHTQGLSSGQSWTTSEVIKDRIDNETNIFLCNFNHTQF